MKVARYFIVAVFALCLVAVQGATDPVPDPGVAFVHLHSPRLACLGTREAPASCVQLAEGYFMDEPTYNKLDVEMKRLQDAETKLAAENASLRKSVVNSQPAWITMAILFSTGAALAVYVDHKL